MRQWNLFSWPGMILLILLLCLGAGIGYFWYGPAGSDERIVYIPTSSRTQTIAQLLQEKRVIRNAAIFRGYAILKGRSHKLFAGEYAFTGGWSLTRVLESLATGKVIQHTVIIPEGYTVSQIAEKLGAMGLVDPAAFQQVAQDPLLAQTWKVPADKLEGFLFPDTYQFTKGMSASSIAQRMVEQFHARVKSDIVQASQKQGLTFLQLITLASIIEREVRQPQERPLVASVFYNRLHKRMRLESCATVLYSLNRHQGALSLEDLNTPSPYNTYRHRGLPPGPICNPGLSAIQAAAYPAKSDYLFFVVQPNGEHVFSIDFENHKRAKWAQKHARPSSLPTASPQP